MKRLRLLVMAAVVMAVMLVSSALPAFAHAPPNLVCPGPGEGQPGPFFGITPPGAIVVPAQSAQCQP
jgi:hypothetical protein